MIALVAGILAAASVGGGGAFSRHHVQRRIGVLAAAYTRDEDRLRISRRIELQADCWMAVTGSSIRSTGLNAADREEMRT